MLGSNALLHGGLALDSAGPAAACVVGFVGPSQEHGQLLLQRDFALGPAGPAAVCVVGLALLLQGGFALDAAADSAGPS